MNAFDDRKFTSLTDDNPMSSAIIIGGHSTIAQAIIQRLLHDGQMDRVYVFSRRETELEYPQLVWRVCQYNEAAIDIALSKLPERQISRLVIYNGLLHQDTIQPEKRLEQLNAEQLQQFFHINTITPMLCLKLLTSRLRHQHDCRVAVFSARIASISDKRLGGGTVTGLPMLLKSAAIELARRVSGVSLLAFHPDTTDTPLSRPFHHNVSAAQLQAPDTVARHLLQLLDRRRPPGAPFAFLDWQGQSVDW